MERLFKLSGLLNSIPETTGSTSPRKFQTAVYLAQEQSDLHMYDFDLRRGKVVSNELDQDISSLMSAGVVASSCGLDDRRSKFVVNKINEQVSSVPDDDGDFRMRLNELLENNSETLEAAASIRYFASRGSSHPRDKLRWFRKLPTERVVDAERILGESP